MSDENQTQAPVEEIKGEVKEETATPTPVEEEKVEVPVKFKSIVDAIESMSVLDLNELVKLLEKKFGVSAAAVAIAGPATGAPGAGGDEKTSFNVELTEVGGQKIAVIKAIKEVLGLGLKEAKDMVDGAPLVMKEGMKKDEAEVLKAKIEEAGGKVTLK